MKSIHPRESCTASARGGYLYVAVMVTAFIVGVVGLSAVHVAQLRLRAAAEAGDHQSARALATAAIEHAVAEFNSNPNWRTDYAEDTEYPSPAAALNGGTFAWTISALDSGVTRLRGIGRAGAGQCVLSVDLGRSGLDCAVVCGGSFASWEGAVTSAEAITVVGGPLHTAGTLDNRGTITGNVEAVEIIGNGGISGTRKVPGVHRLLPEVDQAAAYYVARGTLLNNSALGYGTKTLQNNLLAPYSNPYGSNNGDGIYVIDAGQERVRIRNMRIVGTLVILNAAGGPGVEIDRSVNWEPAHPHYPALVVDGDIEFAYTNDALDEGDIGTNLNPFFTPYQGASDFFRNDDYPSALAGIFYASGNITFNGRNDSGDRMRIHGLVMCRGDCNLMQGAQVDITYDPTFLTSPPPGFGPVGQEIIIPGSWQQRAAE